MTYQTTVLRILPVIAAIAVATACIDDRNIDVDAGHDGERDAAPDAVLPVPLPIVDVMFVVDNSGSMAEEQVTLMDGISEFMVQIFTSAAARGLPIDVHLGVTSTDAGTMGYPGIRSCERADYGDDGCLLNLPSPTIPGCAPSYPRFLARTDEDSDYAIDEFAHDFRCIATLGIMGCGFEQQFEAARRGLVENTAPGRCNEGFLRDRSVVVVVFLTDENDCSVSPDHPEMFDPSRVDLGGLNIRCFRNPGFLLSVEHYKDALDGLTASGHLVVVGALAGVPPDAAECNGFGDTLDGCLAVPEMIERPNETGDQLVPSCDVPGMGFAAPPVRLVQLVQQFGNRGHMSSICRRDYKGGLREIATRIVSLIPDP